jgi:glycosyltransferase involved in cell wall biosynthesis
MKVVIVNTLGGALRHYTAELEDSLRTNGADVRTLSILEPSQNEGGKRRWLGDYLAALRTAGAASRRHGAKVIVTWPLLGYIDLVILHVLVGARASVVVHDTKPLVRSIGYGKVWQRLALWAARGPTLIVHSSQAEADIGVEKLAARSKLLPHPMMSPDTDRRTNTGVATVRVLGQFKPDRDVEGLRAAATQLGRDLDLMIVGRNWPRIEGWKVRSEFVPEEELEQLIRGSSAVVIPYRRFYQSGIAVWCLEVGTPIVGPAGTSLDDLFGADSQLLISEPDGWAAAIEYAISPAGQLAVKDAALRWRTKSEVAWRVWLNS